MSLIDEIPTITLGLLLIVVAQASASPVLQNERAATDFETRCGWFENPTPANISFWDRDGDWTIGVQGGYQVPGSWPWPRFKSGQWVRTNGEHGHGCACLQMRVNKQTFKVLEIKSSRARPLTVCRRDPALKKWHEQ
jgi:uncharacterized protein DUF4087